MAGGAEVEVVTADSVEKTGDRGSGEDDSKGGNFTEKDASFMEKDQSEGLQGAADLGGGGEVETVEDEGGAVCQEEEKEKKEECVVIRETVDVCVQTVDEIACTSVAVVMSEEAVSIEVVKSQDVEKDVTFLVKGESRVGGGIGNDSVDVKVQATEGPCENQGEVAAEPSATEANMGGDSCCPAAEPQIAGGESRTLNGSMTDHDCDGDVEASVEENVLETEGPCQNEEDQNHDGSLSLEISEAECPQVANEETEIRDGSMMDHDRGELEEKQGPSKNQGEVATESTKADVARQLDISRDVDPQVAGEETEVRDGSMVDHNCDGDHEAVVDGKDEAAQGPSQNQGEVATESTEVDAGQHLSVEVGRDAGPQVAGEETETRDGSMMDHDCEENREVASGSTTGKGDIGRHLSLEINQAADPQVVGEETDIRDGSTMDHDCGGELEDSVDQGPNQHQEEVATGFTTGEGDAGLHLSLEINRDPDPQAAGEEIQVPDGTMVDHDFDGDHEASVDGQVQATERPGHNQGEVATESIAVEADIGQHFSSRNSLDADNQVEGEETQIRDDSMMDHDCQEDREASNSNHTVPIAEMQLNTNQNSDEGGITGLDSISVYDGIKLKEDDVGKASSMGDQVKKINLQVASTVSEVAGGSDSCKDQEDAVSPVSITDIHQNICDSAVSGSVSMVDPKVVENDEGTTNNSVDGDPAGERSDKDKEKAPEEPHAASGESEIRDGSMMNHDCEEDQEASNLNCGVSISEMELGTNRICHDGGSFSVDYSVKLQEIDVEKGPGDAVVEEHPQVACVATESDDGPIECTDQEASIMLVSSMSIHQTISDSVVLNSVSTDKCGDVEKDVPRLDEASSKVNEATGHDSFEGDRATERSDNKEIFVEPQAAGQESETKDGSLMDHECEEDLETSNSNREVSMAEIESDNYQNSQEGEIVVSDLVSVDNNIKLQEEDVGKGSNLGDPVEEEDPQVASMATEDRDIDEDASILSVSSMDIQQNISDNVVLGSVSMEDCGVVEKNVPHLEEDSSKVDEGTGCDSLNGDLETERSDNKGEIFAEAVGEETEIREESPVDHNCEEDREACDPNHGVSVAEMESGTKQHSQEGGITVLDSVSVDDSTKLQEEDVEKGSNLSDPVEEEHPQVASVATELDDGSDKCKDASIVPVSSMNIHEDVLDNAVLGSVSVDESEVVEKDVHSLEEGNIKINEGSGHNSLDGDQATGRSDNEEKAPTEPQAVGKETEIQDGSLMDHDCKEDQEASDSNDGVSITEIESGTTWNSQDGGIRGLDSVSVGESTKLQGEDAGKGSNLGGPVEEKHPKVASVETELDDGSDKCNDQEALRLPVPSIDSHQNICDNKDVFHLEDGSSKVDEGAGDDSLNGDRAIERCDNKGVVLEEPQAAGEETETQYRSTVDHNCDGDLKAHSSDHGVYTAEMDTHTKAFVNDSIKLQEDEVGKVSNLDDPVEEHPQEVSVVTAVYSESDKIDQNLGEAAAEPQVVGEETKIQDESMMDHDCDRDLQASCSDQKVSASKIASEINHISQEGECSQVASVAAEADGGSNACEDQGASILQVFSMDTDQKVGSVLVKEEDNTRSHSDPVPSNVQVVGIGEGPSVVHPVSEDEEHKISNTIASVVKPSQNVQEDQETVLVSFSADDTSTEQVDQVEENPELTNFVAELNPQIEGKETVMADESLLDVDKKKEFESSVLETSSLDHQEAVAEASVPETSASVPLGGPLNQADNIEKLPEYADEVIDEQLSDSHKETRVVDESTMDTDPERVQEVSNLQIPSVGDDDMFQQNDILVSDSVPVDERLCHEADHVTEERELVTPLEDGNLEISKINLVSHTHIEEEVKVVTESVPIDNTPCPPVVNAINNLIVTDVIEEAHAAVMNKEVDVNIELVSICCDDSVSHQIDSVVDQTKVDLLTEELNSTSAELDKSITMPVISAETQDSKDFVRPEFCLAESVSELEAPSSDAHPPSENNPMARGDIVANESHIDDVTQGVHGSQIANAHQESTIIEEDTSSLDPQCQKTGLIEELEAKQECLSPLDSNILIDESKDGKQKVQVVEEELVRETEKQAVETSVESDQTVRYYLPPVDKTNFSMSDLVWGKVKSHPWWPGQIFDPSDASKLAMKYQKKESFLIAYFGDKTFAWCDESQLKPFVAYFSQLEKQCSSDTFVKAIHDILTEVTRRVELGMACHCLPEEACSNIKYQKVENAGIRGGDIDSIIDRPTVVDYFQPDRLLQYIVDLAQSPNGRVDKLEFVMARSQLKTFYRSKGYPELPLFTVGGGLMEIVPENSPSVDKRCDGDIVEYLTPLSDLISAKGKSKIGENLINKGEHGSMDARKQKNMPKVKDKGNDLHPANGVKVKSSVKVSEKSILNSSGKKHIVVESDPVASGRCKKRMLDPFGDMEPRLPSPTVASSFKIGEFIRRAASQLTGAPPPILRCQGETFQKGTPEAEHKRDVASDFDIVPGSPAKERGTKLIFTEDFKPTDEMLSQLHLAARDPMKTHNFVSPIVSFFTGFRSSCVSPSSEDEEHIKKQEEVQKPEHLEKRKRGRPRKVITEKVSSDHNSAEDENQVKKRKKGMQKRVIPQLASSDISSSDETKHSEKRIRRRPRKYSSQPDSSDSSSSDDKLPVQKRGKGRPKKKNLASPGCNSSENKKKFEDFEHPAHCEKRKRGRPKKVHLQIVPSDISSPDHMKDSCCSDVNMHIKRNKKGHTQIKNKRAKSSRESSFSPSMDPMQQHIEQHLQLVAVNPNLKHAFAAERSIISVEEKIVDERMPTVLVLSFNNANSLPSETDLIRIFSRYGPLKEAETDILRKSNRAKVVFKRRVDAERAFSSAGKYSIFGPGLLSYQLRPWTPKSTPQAIPQVIHDESLFTTLQDTHDAELSTASQGTHDAAPSTISHGTHDAASTVIVQNRSDTGDAAGSDLGHLEQEDVVMTSDQIQSEAECMKSSLQDEHDLSFVTTLRETHDAAADIAVEEKSDIRPAEGSNLRHLEQAEVLRAPNSIQIEAEGVESCPKNMHDPLVSPPEKHEPVSTATSQSNLDEGLMSMQQDNHDAAPMDLQQDKHDSATRRDDKLEVSDQVETQMASGSNQVEDDHGDSQVSEQAETRTALNALQLKTEVDDAETSDRFMQSEVEGKESSG